MIIFIYVLHTDAAILLWKLNDSKEPEQAAVFQEEEDSQLNKESWSVVKTLRYTKAGGTHVGYIEKLVVLDINY